MTHNRCLRKQMAQQMFLTLTIETDGFNPHNRNRWPHNSRATAFCHAWPILLFALVSPFYPLLSCIPQYTIAGCNYPNAHAFLNLFIHSGHFYSAPSSLVVLRGTPDYSTDTVSEFHAEAHRQLQVNDLPMVPTWRLERESNPRFSG